MPPRRTGERTGEVELALSPPLLGTDEVILSFVGLLLLLLFSSARKGEGATAGLTREA